MIDDTLTLPAIASPPDATPGAVVHYSLDDGDTIRGWAVLPDGTRHLLTPPPVGSPASVRLATDCPGPTVPRALTSGEWACCIAGPIDRDVPIGTEIAVSWSTLVTGAPGWAQVAIHAGPANLGNAPGAIVASADAVIALGTLGPSTVTATTTAPIAAGSVLRVVLATWGGSSAQVAGSLYPDPLASGAVCRVIGDVGNTRPSQVAAVVLDAQNAGPPFAAAVLVP